MTDVKYSELKRKIFHWGTLVYPLLYNILPRNVGLVVAGTVVVIDIILESVRLTFPQINDFVLRVFKSIYRDNEKYNVSGLIWTFTGAFLVIFIFDNKQIVTTTLLYMCLGDSIAGLVGTHHGKTKIGYKRYKSLEGSFACFVICFLCGIFFLPWQLAFIGAVIATIIEFLPLPLNDNFWVPLISGFALTFFGKFFLP